eukprot:TRINITY_DN2982_c0_g1_i1.p1 TRINITY_DN2982_c0_g1~~TRINITY_DN2982_c0_g1_i1.p1  ORF type:complete len:389 (-),score=69.84 TRINITY_DN2982_c0_g1_i1:43-1209(-)
MVNRLLDLGVPIDSQNINGETPLFIACRKTRRTDIPQLLVKLGADCNITDNAGFSPLHCSVLQGNLAVLKLLLCSGADPQLVSPRGTAWDIAMTKSFAEILAVLDSHVTVMAIPVEVVIAILQQLGPVDLYRLRRVCTHFRRICQGILDDPLYWNSLQQTRECFEALKGKAVWQSCRNVPPHYAQEMNTWVQRLPQCTTCELRVKLACVGTGCSSFMSAFADRIFPSPISMDLRIVRVRLHGLVVQIQLWDKMNERVVRTVYRHVARYAHGFLAMYDITSKNSLIALRDVLTEIDKCAPTIPQVVLLGTKLDQAKELGQHAVTLTEAEELRPGAPVLEVSSMDHTNVELAVKALVELVLANRLREELQVQPTTDAAAAAANDKKCTVM